MSIQLVLNISGNKTKSSGSYWLIREINYVPLKPAPQPVQLAELAAKESSWPYLGQDRHVASNVPRFFMFFSLLVVHPCPWESKHNGSVYKEKKTMKMNWWTSPDMDVYLIFWPWQKWFHVNPGFLFPYSLGCFIEAGTTLIANITIWG